MGPFTLRQLRTSSTTTEKLSTMRGNPQRGHGKKGFHKFDQSSLLIPETDEAACKTGYWRQPSKSSLMHTIRRLHKQTLRRFRDNILTTPRGCQQRTRIHDGSGSWSKEISLCDLGQLNSRHTNKQTSVRMAYLPQLEVSALVRCSNGPIPVKTVTSSRLQQSKL